MYNKDNYHVPKELVGASLVNDHWLVNNWYNSTVIQKRLFYMTLCIATMGTLPLTTEKQAQWL